MESKQERRYRELLVKKLRGLHYVTYGQFDTEYKNHIKEGDEAADMIEELVTRIETLENALKKYGAHTDN